MTKDYQDFQHLDNEENDLHRLQRGEGCSPLDSTDGSVPLTQLLSPLVTPSSVSSIQKTVAESPLLGRLVQDTVLESFLVTVTSFLTSQDPRQGGSRAWGLLKAGEMSLLSVSSEFGSLAFFSFDSVYEWWWWVTRTSLAQGARLKTLGEGMGGWVSALMEDEASTSKTNPSPHFFVL